MSTQNDSNPERLISFQEAIKEGLSESIEKNPDVFLMGEGIDDPSSFWGTTAGIAQRFGRDSVLEMPVAENGLVGVAIGAAMAGLRPVMNFQRVEFALLAVEQIFNNAAKAHYVSNGLHRVPLVIRLVIGRGWGQGPGHSQALESVFAHIPGLKVIMPTFGSDAKGMLITAIEDDSPVIIIEHRWLYSLKDHVPAGYFKTPLDGPRVIRKGKDATIVATSYNVLEAIRAADVLKDVGCDVEIVDMRVLNPLNYDPIIESVSRTGRLITVDTGWTAYGVGGEVIAEITSRCFSSLKAATVRLGMSPHPTPSSRGLIPGFYPDAASIVDAVVRTVGLDETVTQKLSAQLIEEREELPIDVPDPFFKGPF
ncbi:alpha-ketoacid dehydrogenase subunit beta [Rhodospirillales bacterium]|nr:alpha-ketoacid dehydrogenase subunit beta [Rhodospirillales bacterium]